MQINNLYNCTTLAFSRQLFQNGGLSNHVERHNWDWELKWPVKFRFECIQPLHEVFQGEYYQFNHVWFHYFGLYNIIIIQNDISHNHFI